MSAGTPDRAEAWLSGPATWVLILAITLGLMLAVRLVADLLDRHWPDPGQEGPGATERAERSEEDPDIHLDPSPPPGGSLPFWRWR